MSGSCVLTLLVAVLLRFVHCELTDLTHTVKPGASSWPTLPPFSLNVTHNGTTENGYWYQIESACAGTHYATHLDAPCHFSRGAWCVQEIPLDRLVGRPGVCVHLQDKIGSNGNYQVDTRDFQAWEDDHGRIPHGAIVLIHTGWSRFWEDENKYRGTADPSPSQHRFPGLAVSGAQWLADQRKVYGVGIDTLSIDYGQTRKYETHVLLARKKVFILENVANLEDLPPIGFTVHAMPVKLDKVSGAAARVVAVVNEETGIATAGLIAGSVLLGLVVVVAVRRRFTTS